MTTVRISGGVVHNGWREEIFGLRADHQIRSIAVLPLVNLSGDSEQEYFSDGMTDELITSIAKATPLQVISRTSVMRYKGTKKSLGDIARELGVEGIIGRGRDSSFELPPTRIRTCGFPAYGSYFGCLA